MTVWVNGRLLADDTPVVSAFDHGLTVGDGVFETAKVEAGRPFALRRHLRRLAASAAAMGLPVDLDRVRAAVGELLAHVGPIEFGRLRVTLTGGLAPLATERGESGPLLVVAVMPITRPTLPLRLVTVPWPRNERGATAGVKTTSYAENVVALAYAHEHGGDEAVFLNTLGNVCEGTGSNLFVGIEGRLFTPPLSAGCLAGITRELLLEWVSTIEERDLSADVLRRADEVFITSSTRDVLAASAVDGRGLPAPGPLTRAAAEVFRERSTADPDP